MSNFFNASSTVANSAVFPQNWASFNQELPEELSNRGFLASFAMPLRFFGPV